MPNPPQYHRMLPREAAMKANAQVSAMADYMQRFLARLDELGVAENDPLHVNAKASHRALIDLGVAIVMASKPPNKTRWE